MSDLSLVLGAVLALVVLAGLFLFLGVVVARRGRPGKPRVARSGSGLASDSASDFSGSASSCDSGSGGADGGGGDGGGCSD